MPCCARLEWALGVGVCASDFDSLVRTVATLDVLQSLMGLPWMVEFSCRLRHAIVRERAVGCCRLISISDGTHPCLAGFEFQRWHTVRTVVLTPLSGGVGTF